MKATDFNKIDNTYLLIEQKSKDICKENNIDFYEYISVFKNLLINYIKNKNHIEVVKNCNFNDEISTRAILNKANFSTKENEINEAVKTFENSKLKLFSWLDKIKDPYFFILNPIYKYGAGVGYNSYFSKAQGYKKINFTGIQNLKIAEEYAIYKLNYKII